MSMSCDLSTTLAQKIHNKYKKRTALIMATVNPTQLCHVNIPRNGKNDCWQSTKLESWIPRSSINWFCLIFFPPSRFGPKVSDQKIKVLYYDHKRNF